MAPAAKSAAFEKAVEDSRKLKTKPTSDELLEVCLFFPFFSPRYKGEGRGEIVDL